MAKEEKRQMMVKMVIRQELNDVIGGFENSLMDKLIDKMPTHDELVAQIYTQVMQARVVETPNGTRIGVEKDIRFFGTDRIKAFIDRRVAKEGY